MAQGTHLYFVTWPDGKVDDESVNIYGTRNAIARMIRTWLPEHVFGKQTWLDGSGSYMADQIWRGMSEKGFKAHAIEVPQPAPTTPDTPA